MVVPLCSDKGWVISVVGKKDENKEWLLKRAPLKSLSEKMQFVIVWTRRKSISTKSEWNGDGDLLECILMRSNMFMNILMVFVSVNLVVPRHKKNCMQTVFFSIHFQWFFFIRSHYIFDVIFDVDMDTSNFQSWLSCYFSECDSVQLDISLELHSFWSGHTYTITGKLSLNIYRKQSIFPILHPIHFHLNQNIRFSWILHTHMFSPLKRIE